VDHRGWAFCYVAVGVSRLTGLPVHRAAPTVDPLLDVCRNCPFAAAAEPAEIRRLIASGEIEYPSPIYRGANRGKE
jgi:hypothetical protein